LQHRGALAAIHGPVTKEEFTHLTSPASRWLYSLSCVH